MPRREIGGTARGGRWGVSRFVLVGKSVCSTTAHRELDESTGIIGERRGLRRIPAASVWLRGDLRAASRIVRRRSASE